MSSTSSKAAITRTGRSRTTQWDCAVAGRGLGRYPGRRLVAGLPGSASVLVAGGTVLLAAWTSQLVGGKPVHQTVYAGR